MEEAQQRKEELQCPFCKTNTGIIVKEDTVLYLLPLYCTKCKKEVVISLVKFSVMIHEDI